MSPTYKKVQTPVLVHESGSWSCDYRHHTAHYGQDGCMGSYNESEQTHILEYKKSIVLKLTANVKGFKM